VSTVTLFTSPGRGQAGGNTLTSLKVTPLPEPSSSALVIPGALMVLGMARRRARLSVRSCAASESRAKA